MGEEKKGYCRVCGSGKGHNFGGCQNVRGLKEIIRLQDHEEEKVRELSRKVNELTAERDRLQTALDLTSRVMHALLDANERFRDKEKGV